VLNSDYSPMGIIDWRKAMILAFRYKNKDFTKIEIVEYHNDDYVTGINNRLEVPAVIKTTRYFRLFNSSVNFSRKNVFIRDNFVCQYCSKKFPINKLTYDHVIPKSKWKSDSTPTSWTNIVTSCLLCNLKKGNKTPEQANMPLKKIPEIPKKTWKYLPLACQLHTIDGMIPEKWHTYVGDIANNAQL
jgi:5-methylcytosine-specific restriction endonuclease McrA